MAAIHDLLKQIEDPRLRERIAREWEAATKHKKFGLVYEQHLPELLSLYDATPRKGDLVARRGGTLSETWRVRRIEGGKAQLIRPRAAGERESAGERLSVAVDELLVVKQFGEPIFPTLTPVEAVQNGPDDAPWHVLIEADNYHALQLLEYLYAGRVDCIYIDPPYNTGARDWKYNNDYVDGNDSWRHSKWLSFMEKRLRLAKRLLNDQDSVLIVTIDENEVHRLALILEKVFPRAIIQMITSVINPRGVYREGAFSRCDEYIMFVMLGRAKVLGEADKSYGEGTDIAWRTLRRSDLTSARRTLKGGPNQFYPIYVNNKSGIIEEIGDPILPEQERTTVPIRESCSAVFPVRIDGTEMNWGLTPGSLRSLWNNGFVKVGAHKPSEPQQYVISYLTSGRIDDIRSGRATVVGRDNTGAVIAKYQTEKIRMPVTCWAKPTHNAETGGSNVVRAILGDKRFPFPKSIYAVEDALRYFVGNKPNALVLDFFAGSGTTAHAVLRLNQQDGGKRKSVVITNNEVGANEVDALTSAGHQSGDPAWEARGICRSVTWPRLKFAILGRRDDDAPLPGEYVTGRMAEREKRRSFKHVNFLTPEDFRIPDGLSAKDRAKAHRTIAKKQKGLVGLIDGLPQNAVTEERRYIVSEDYKAAMLFDPDAVEDWLAALDEQDHITKFYIVADKPADYNAIKAQVEELLGPQIVQEEEKRPMAEGFAANLAYFKLDFLDKDRVELGAAFREILPLLWLKADAVGPRPELPEGTLPDYFAPVTANFAVLLSEARIGRFLDTLKGRWGLSHVFIVTDAEEAFRALSDELRAALGADNPDLALVQLYRDYLVNFMINTRVDDAPIGRGGEA